MPGKSILYPKWYAEFGGGALLPAIVRIFLRYYTAKR